MKKLNLLFVLFIMVANAQVIDIKISDYSNNLSIDDADVYFTHSRKNFVSDMEGKVIVDLSSMNQFDELIVSKKDYQDVRIKVSTIKSDLIVKLKKIPKVELQEALVRNMNIKDILEKVIDNYSKNFNVDKYYFLANLQQTSIVDTVYKDLIDVDLQFKFDKGKIKVKSTGRVNNKYEEGETSIKTNFNSSDYLRHLYLFDGLKSMNDNFLKNKYTNTKLVGARYAEKSMFEIYLDKGNNERNYLLIDRETFSVVEYVLNIKNELKTNIEGPLKRNGTISFKYRPYLEGWVLKESDVKFFMTLLDENNNESKVNLEYKLNAYDFNELPFAEFKKNVSIRSDIRRSF